MPSALGLSLVHYMLRSSRLLPNFAGFGRDRTQRMILPKAFHAAVALLLARAGPARAGPRLDAIKARGALHCGVAANEPGMSVAAAGGNYIGFEADLCRAIAIAIFGAPKVVFKPTTTLQDFLRSDDV